MPAVATLKPVGNVPLDSSVFSTAPWELWGVFIPQYGSPPTYAQFDVEVLQPPNVDGNRYRIAGAHFPEFTVNGIVPAVDFQSAGLLAREIERTKGGQMEFQYTRSGSSPYTFYVKEARCLASASRILGASVQSGGGWSNSAGPAPSTDANAAVDISLVLQYFAA